jgi:hypothetical protein
VYCLIVCRLCCSTMAIILLLYFELPLLYINMTFAMLDSTPTIIHPSIMYIHIHSSLMLIAQSIWLQHYHRIIVGASQFHPECQSADAYVPTSSHIYICVLICSKFLMTTKFASMKRSTQFCIQGSSLLSSLPDEILPVMHLRKQVSVREWIAVGLLVSKQYIEVIKK